MGPAGERPDPDESELIRRLRRRADQLRAGGDPDHADAAPEPETEPEPEPGTGRDPGAERTPDTESDPVADDPAPAEDLWADPPPGHWDLLSQWADEEHLETDAPRRNWAPLYVLAAVVVALAAGFFLFRFATDDADGSTGTDPRGEDAEAPSVTDADPPTLDDLTAEVTVPPGPEEGLAVADQGITIVEDRFDPARREGTFAAVIQNPHSGWLAQGVQVEVEFLDEAGNVAGRDRAFLEVVLPEQTVAVGALFFDAPTVPVTGMNVVIDVARWRETEPPEGEVTTAAVTTEAAEFSGVRTSFVLRSSFAEPLHDVGVTAVYRNEAGQIIGGSDTFVDLLEPDTDTPVELSLLANVDVGQVASTELYPSAGFGFVIDDD